MQPSLDKDPEQEKIALPKSKTVTFDDSSPVADVLSPPQTTSFTPSWMDCSQISGRPKRYTTQEKVEDRVAAFWERVNTINNGITVRVWFEF